MSLRTLFVRALAALGLVVIASLGGVSAAGTATADEASASGLAYCPGATDGLGHSVELCLNDVSTSTLPGQVGYTAEARGALTVCTTPSRCITQPFFVGETGGGANPGDAVPSITYEKATTVPLSRVCAGSVCTPDRVSVPQYKVTVFRDPDPTSIVCINGKCVPVSPVTPAIVTDNEGVPIAQLVAG